MTSAFSSKESSFLLEIRDLLAANGWENLLILEEVSGPGAQSVVRVSLSKDHLTAPLSLVNEYSEGFCPLEQIQQECLRALRTGRTGL